MSQRNSTILYCCSTYLLYSTLQPYFANRSIVWVALRNLIEHKDTSQIVNDRLAKKMYAYFLIGATACTPKPLFGPV